MELSKKRAVLAGIAFFFIAILNLAAEASGAGSFTGLLSLIMVGGTVFLVAVSLIRHDGSIGTDITHPMSLYGFFYFLYYLLPYLILFFTVQLPEGMELFIATLLWLGYLSWLIGSKSFPQAQGRIEADRVERAEAIALLAVCIVGIGLVGYSYMWRIADGIFFNHARFVTQELTVAASIGGSLSQQVRLPIILLLGLLSSVRQEDIAGISRRLLKTYGIGIFFVMVLSSEIRPAITAIVFLFIGTRFYRQGATKLRQIALVSALSFSAVVVAHGLRIISAVEFADAPNQFLFAVENAIPHALSTIYGHQEELGNQLVSRGGGAIAFLAEIVSAIGDRGAVFYGQGIIDSLPGLIPRFVWLDKPAVMPPQLVAQEMLGFLSPYDASFGPITQFYFEGGLIGVIGGYMLFGWGMAWLTSRAIQSQSIGLWVTLCFIWGHVANIEQELVLGVLGSLRSAVLVVCLWRFCVFLISHMARNKALPTSWASARRE